jgi:hypothetical protein
MPPRLITGARREANTISGVLNLSGNLDTVVADSFADHPQRLLELLSPAEHAIQLVGGHGKQQPAAGLGVEEQHLLVLCYLTGELYVRLVIQAVV